MDCLTIVHITVDPYLIFNVKLDAFRICHARLHLVGDWLIFGFISAFTDSWLQF
jgi:hypothetical protein